MPGGGTLTLEACSEPVLLKPPAQPGNELDVFVSRAASYSASTGSATTQRSSQSLSVNRTSSR